MLLLIYRNFLYRRLRSWLTILGIIIGTTLIVGLLLLGDGMKRAVATQLQNFGGDLIFVFPGKEENPFIGMVGKSELRNKDVDIIGGVSGARVVLPMQTKTLRAQFHGEEKPVLIHGSPLRETKIIFEESQGFAMEQGQWPQNDNISEVVLGAKVAKERFRESIKIGEIIVVRGKKFEVRGILKTVSEGASNSMIYFSLKQFRKLTGDTSGVGSVAIKATSGYKPEDVAAEIKSQLLRQKGAVDFAILTSSKASRLIGDILGVIQLILGGIAAVALIVGGIGIMNAMFTSVLERTHEIGILKAVGATNKKILLIFLIESGLLGAMGGAMGLILSISLTKFAEFFAHRKGFVFFEILINPPVLFLILTATFLLGIIFGLVPAWRAARFKPTEALRYE